MEIPLNLQRSIQVRSPFFHLLRVYIVVGSTAADRGVTTGLAGGTGNTQINGNDDNSSSGGGAGASAPQLVITNPDRLVPVQITIPAQPGNPASVPRALTVQVPAHALQQTGPTSQMLQQVLTQAIWTDHCLRGQPAQLIAPP